MANTKYMLKYERQSVAESFESYHSFKKRRYPYYRIYVKNFVGEQWCKITKEIGADIQAIDMPLLNTDTSYGDLRGVFMAGLVPQILAYVAEILKNLILPYFILSLRA